MNRFIVIILLLAGYAVAEDRAQVSRTIEERTGHPLNPASKAAGRQSPTLPPGVSLAGKLSEDDAVAIALWNNAALEADLASLGLARADLVEAGLLRNPNLSVLLPVGPKPFELLLGLPVEALWQRPRRVSAAKLNLEAVAEGLVQHGLNLVRDVRLAHAELAAAEQRSMIATEAAELLQKIAELTERRLRAGEASGLEVALARTEARAAEDQGATFSRDAAIAGERLRSLMGLRHDKTPLSADPAAPERPAPPDWDDLFDAAVSARPDLRAAELAVQAAGKRAGWERSKILALGPALSSKGVGDHGVRTGPGFFLDLPLFHRNQGAISRAEAEVERAALAYLALRDQVELEVRQARLEFARAAESVERIRTRLLPSVQETIRLAGNAYAAGDASYLSVLETTRQIHAVRLKEAAAAADLRRASAQLDRSVGKRL